MTGFDSSETKLPTYTATPFNKVCIGMKDGNRNRFISVAVAAKSLYALIAPGAYVATSLGRDTWKSLVSSPSLQHHCNREGFNSKSANERTKTRIGIIANEQRECHSPDSFIGIGGTLKSTGNKAQHQSDNGDRDTATIGYVLVQ